MKQSLRRIALRSAASRPRALIPATRIIPQPPVAQPQQCRTLFGLFKSNKARAAGKRPPPTPLFGPDDLFHPLGTSPVPSLRAKAAQIESLAPCPVCLDHQQRKKVGFTCPDCGFPTHCSHSHWEEGREAHAEYCGRLREVNEDEHDLRSGRAIKEFELPGPQDYESTPSFKSWDTLFYTRNFGSIDSDRSRRHVSKLLTYPISVAAALHQNGPFSVGSGTLENGAEGSRWTREGRRSMAALHTSLHPPTGEPPSSNSRNAKIPIRVFILGARAESSLPPHVWEQITYLFPFTQFKIYFIGPQAALPAKPSISLSSERSTSKTITDPRQIYSPATPVPSSETTGRGRVDTDNYGVPSYTLSVSSTLQLITLQARYEDVHEQFGPFDPYTDVFFTFCPGFGFPSPSVPHGQGKGIVQAEREWAQMLRQVLTTKCPLFITAFSPTDLERDVKSLDKVPGVRGEYDLLLEPGENGFGSLKWEPADFDPRVMVRVNWGIWAIRGKRYEVKPSNDEE